MVRLAYILSEDNKISNGGLAANVEE